MSFNNLICFDENFETNENDNNNNEGLAKTIDTLPWIEKYRPKTLSEIISNNHVINTLSIFIKNKCLPHLLFYGQSGVGKTSGITACAKELYGQYYPFMVMELNASDDRGIEVVRNKIKQFVTAKNVFFGMTESERLGMFKLVILDETDAMTSDAQAILRKIVEKYTNTTRFCLICNYIQKINPALQSRCTKFRFSPLNNDEIKKRVMTIIKQEKIKVTASGLEAILKIARGDMRKVLNNLQSTSMAYQIVNEKNVNNCLGYPRKMQIEELINSLIEDEFSIVYDKLLSLRVDDGLSLNDIIIELHDILVEFIINKTHEYKSIKKLNTDKLIFILDKLRDIEYNQSLNTNEDFQMGAVIGAFKLIL